ncbi:hypothetical protein [Singulisphaera acidiphila]|uniref:Uncharacterized protein n=1 Tax=Singulisphaera acidiphila (strain ATCC BAA-1392 / DSM 18658 / VKM B-2454 / MOB10) TaxID=886293 RepID=L0DNC1_SINAD|nr:hypothetical protein [Singulisphaera acidiphila]AGA30325.1 hypothetical protein Sinac_6227 [Singulisphaera acidiphila DSM 18658]
MKTLALLPAGVNEAFDLVERFDETLLHGFARLGDEHRARLEPLAGVFAGSPLGPVVAEAFAAVGRNEFVARYFLALASARVALLGAAHDALVAQAHEALGRPSPTGEEPPPLPMGRSATALASVQQWLTELAIAGFKHLEETTVAPFAATLENLQADPELTGLASLLTGFSNELLRSMPASRQPELPGFRWGDLWSASMVRTQQLPGASTFREAEGVFTPLGLDLQSHDNFACALLYGVLDDGEARTVRIPFAGYKVDVIAGAGVWDLFEPYSEPILAALEAHKTLRIAKAELRANGDLILRSPPKAGSRADPFAAADRLSPLPCPSPMLRHPVHIAEAVRLPSDHGLPLAMERLPGGTELTESVIHESPELLGLLRVDRGGWRVQPLCVRVQKDFLMSGEGLAGVRRKFKHRPLEVLKERSSRLLRRKA